jgi:hypothetical protein
MSFRINSTGRKRILRECIKIRLIDVPPGQPPAFAASISLPADLALPSDARVYLEPYVGSSSMRFEFGSVGVPITPERCVMSEVDAGASILFRLKVVDESEVVGRILAAADGLRPEGDADGQDRKPLLPLRSMDLGEEIWRLDLDKDAGPTLCINNRVPNLAERLQSDALLQGVIYPQVARQVLRYVQSEKASVDDADADWMNDWSDWFDEELGRSLEEEEIDDDFALETLVNELASAFATRMKFASTVASLMSQPVS